MGRYAEDMTGQKFGLWTVIERKENNIRNKSMWLCRCQCGNERIVIGQGLRTGESKSCGCSRIGRTGNKGNKNTKHGGYHTLAYSSWYHMKDRCNNPNDKRYKDYGGRGIQVCERWLNSFENFLADMGERPSKDYSLDRIDVNRNYTPGNCKWSTKTEQRNNRRDSRK